MNVRDFLKLIRINNILIVVITQYFIEYIVLRPGLDAYGLHAYLNHFEFFLLVLCTAIITAGGNVVNDLYDVEIDKINRPEKQVVQHKISIENTYRLYISIVASGAIIALYMSLKLGRLSLFILYPIAVGILWIYSRWFKRLPLSGNIIIAIFTMIVPLVLLIPEWKNVISPGFRTSIYLFIIIGFSFFAGLTNFIREIVKDLEDYQGDKMVGAATLPVVIGIRKTRNIILGLILVLISAILSWIYFYYSKIESYNILLYSLVLLALCGFLFWRVWHAVTPKHYKMASSIIKLIMVAGLIYLFFL